MIYKSKGLIPMSSAERMVLYKDFIKKPKKHKTHPPHFLSTKPFTKYIEQMNKKAVNINFNWKIRSNDRKYNCAKKPKTTGTWALQYYEVYAFVGILQPTTTENKSTYLVLLLLSITHIHPSSQGIRVLWNLNYAALSR